MSAVLTQRLVRVSGMLPPPRPFLRVLARAPRARLVRAVAWLAHEAKGGTTHGLLSGLRLVVRGWDDVVVVLSAPGDAPRAELEHPVRGRGLVYRAARAGRGWEKDTLLFVGAVRPEIELAVAWFHQVVGCVTHDDCAFVPELGAACLASAEA